MTPTNPTRRQAIATLVGAAAVAALPRISATEMKPESKSAPATGGIRHSVCRWCYNKMPLEEFARAVKDMGLESIELLGPDEWHVVQKLGLTCAIANGTTTIPQGLNRLENHEKMVPSMIGRIGEVAAAGLPNVIVFSGNRDGMDDELGLENCAIALKQIVPAAEKAGVTVCMELLNSKVNHADYMCDRTHWGVELVKRVGSERFKLLYDIYHMQIMEGDVIATIRENAAYIGHYHTGGVPGRNEIDEGQELYYPAIMRAIRDTGYKGFVAQEFIPKRDPLTSLREGVRICTV
jgi:hydroxypyruvate isomerase